MVTYYVAHRYDVSCWKPWMTCTPSWIWTHPPTPNLERNVQQWTNFRVTSLMSTPRLVLLAVWRFGIRHAGTASATQPRWPHFTFFVTLSCLSIVSLEILAKLERFFTGRPEFFNVERTIFMGSGYPGWKRSIYSRKLHRYKLFSSRRYWASFFR